MWKYFTCYAIIAISILVIPHPSGLARFDIKDPMAAISRIKQHQVLFTVTRQKMGNTTMSYDAVHRVKVTEVDPAGKFVMASWNGNAVRRYSESHVAKWKVNEPVKKPNPLSC